MVLKDIWNLENQQVITLVQWIAKAIINQAKEDAQMELTDEILKIG